MSAGITRRRGDGVEHICEGLQRLNAHDEYQLTTISDNVLGYSDIDNTGVEFTINYCPWCGQEMKGVE